ncbi:MAG: hypothetical protein HY645_04230 [Acidobacteria bacterium]|nr:hypothetical protein [Acidobacteriota bacterium]
MNLLGISCYFHDAAAALVRDGKVVAAAEEERFSRIKHDYGFPQRAIDFCLSHARIDAGELDYVVFFEKPFLKFERLLLSSMQTFPRSHAVFREAMVGWLGDKLWIKHLIQRRLNLPASKILFSEHHLSHAGSAFFCSPFDEAAVLTIDGVGEWATAAYGVGRNTSLRLLREIRYPHSLGLLYSAFTAFLGFEVNEGEYKVMGMAPFGQPRYLDKVQKLIHLANDGSFQLDLDYFCFHHSISRTFNQKFESLFGKPRDPEEPFFTETTGFPSYLGNQPSNANGLAERNQYYADVAASIQKVTEEVLLKMARRVHDETGLEKLCLAGGVALNSVANARIFQETPFQEIYIQPAAGDGGGALGAALYAYHAVLGKPRNFVMDHAYWGQEHSSREIAQFLSGNGIKASRLSRPQLVEQTVGLLEKGKVVGWVQGRFEWGPRALGNRSILADPRRANMKDIVNTKIKFREPFRPFAPSIPVENVSEYFEVKNPRSLYPCRFMLFVLDIRGERRPCIPAVTHVDGTGRLQAVHEDTNPLYHQLIRSFGQATGTPVLLNTSFNLKGEPICNTPQEAYQTFQRSDMDVLVLGDWMIEKP